MGSVWRSMNVGLRRVDIAGKGFIGPGLDRRSYKSKAVSYMNGLNPDADIFSEENVTFGNMTAAEIMRSIGVLRICSIPGFSDNAAQVMEVGKLCLGEYLFNKLMRATAYGQFVAGNKIEEIHSSARRLADINVAQMLAVPIEAPEGNQSSSSRNELFEGNLTKILDCVDLSRATSLEGRECLMQIKLTAIMDFDSLVDVSTKLKENAFCNYDSLQNWITTGCHANDLISIAPSLDEMQAQTFAGSVRRLIKVINHAEMRNVSVLIDAEHTWINPAIQYLGIVFMRLYNRLRPIVYLTYQGYLKETRELLQEHVKECRASNVHFALKLVRGAYVVAETKRCGHHPPYMCENWEATNKNYDRCLTDLLCLEPDFVRIVVASHNENSIRLAVKLLRERHSFEKNPVPSNISFAQLYGMADYMSFTLGNMGYQVYKSVPYGTVDETLLYLSRRVKENCLVLSGIRKEMAMLKKGLGHRLSGRKIN